jgi:TRAP-type mannitol/chloroaromatic compound transport system permease large subunit
MRLREAVLAAFKLSSMVIWLIMGITAFSNVYHASGASDIIKSAALLVSQNVGGLAVIIMMMVLIFLFGMIMDDAAVIMVVGPIFAPIVVHLGFDPIWFGVLFMINMQCAWLTPPYGFNLFLIRAVAPPSISASDIVRSVWPFICIQIVCLLLVLFIPNIALWLPSVMFKS